MSSRIGESHKTNKKYEKRQTMEKSKEKLKLKNSKLPLKSTPPNTFNAISPLYIDIIMFLLSTIRLAESSTNFVSILSIFDNKLIRYKPRKE
jgi:hypothetical protein